MFRTTATYLNEKYSNRRKEASNSWNHFSIIKVYNFFQMQRSFKYFIGFPYFFYFQPLFLIFVKFLSFAC